MIFAIVVFLRSILLTVGVLANFLSYLLRASP